MAYRVQEDVVHKARAGWHLFWDPKTLAWAITDEIGAFVLESLRPRRTLDELVAEIAAQTGAPVSEVLPEVAKFLKDVAQAGLLEAKPSSALHTGSEEIPPSPTFLYLHLTSRCKLRCSYCYVFARQDEAKKGQDLPFPLALKVLRQAQDLGVKEVIVTGGEPLLHPQAPQILEEAKHLGLTVNLLTNGVLIDRELAGRLAKICDQITVSLDSADPICHELHRGQGTHTKASRAIRLLNEAGAPHVVAAAVLTRHNQDERYEDFLTYAKSLGAEKVARQVYILQGDHRDEPLRPDLPRLLASLEKELEAAVAQNLPREGKTELVWRNQCGAASGVVAVGADGLVYPCQSLVRPEFAAGDLRQKSLGEIYQNAQMMREVRAITVKDIPGCANCPYRFLCGGGCRALAYNVSGSLYAAIPPEYCALSQLLAEWKLWQAALQRVAFMPAELTM